MTPVFCAIDTTDLKFALELSKQMQQAGAGIKLGMEFFSANGPQGAQKITEAFPELPVFIDLKYHDIPTTVKKAGIGLIDLQPAYFNVHTLGGFKMMREVVNGVQEAADKKNMKAPKILGVTILTSHDADDLVQIGLTDRINVQVMQLATLANGAGLAGVVCSGKEIKLLRETFAQEFALMVPGIRPAGAEVQDQKRVMTPLDAFKAGASHLVIGRPITEAEDPAQAAYEIIQSLKI